MIDRYIHHSKYFCGNKISDYGLANGYVDYQTLAKSGNLVLCNSIISNRAEYIDPVLGSEYDDVTDEYREVFQWYIIDEALYETLARCCPDEIVYYDNEYGVYIWGITHYGTSWDYVLTDIKIEIKTEDAAS